MNPAAPIPVIPLEYAKPTTVPRRRRWLLVARWSLAIAALDMLVGLILIPAWDTDTVVVPGPILFVLGVVLLVASMKLRLLPGVMLGLAHCAVPLLFTMLVNVRGWSPDEATYPFLIMGGVYLVIVALPASVLVFFRMRALAIAMRGSEPSPATNLPSAGGIAEAGG